MMLKKGWMGVMVLSLLCCFVVGVASAADVDVREVEQEVRILYELNKLGLNGDQLDQIISTLKEVEVIYTTARDEYENLLLQQKDLLLAGKMDEAEVIQSQKGVIREKARLDALSKLIDLQLILTPEQKKLLSPIGFGRVNGNGQNNVSAKRFSNHNLNRADQLGFKAPRAINDKGRQIIEKPANLPMLRNLDELPRLIQLLEEMRAAL